MVFSVTEFNVQTICGSLIALHRTKVPVYTTNIQNPLEQGTKLYLYNT